MWMPTAKPARWLLDRKALDNRSTLLLHAGVGEARAVRVGEGSRVGGGDWVAVGSRGGTSGKRLGVDSTAGEGEGVSMEGGRVNIAVWLGIRGGSNSVGAVGAVRVCDKQETNKVDRARNMMRG